MNYDLHVPSGRRTTVSAQHGEASTIAMKRSVLSISRQTRTPKPIPRITGAMPTQAHHLATAINIDSCSATLVQLGLYLGSRLSHFTSSVFLTQTQNSSDCDYKIYIYIFQVKQ